MMKIEFEVLSIKYETQALLKKGLKSHWGEYDDAYNPDIINLFESYNGQVIVGLKNTVELVRFSVASEF